MSWREGVVIGKFLPPHAGHLHLIASAQARVERLSVIVCERPDDPIAGALRRDWLRELCPAARVLLVEDRYDPHDSRLWAELTLGWLGARPDVAFTSEDYGATWAAHLGAAHVLVDRARARFPVSGSAVRADPFACWAHLPPPVRAWYARRVIVLGAESTGTTTLARALAGSLGTPWVPEVGREVTADKWSRGQTEWTSDEFLAIATEQGRREDAAAREADRVVVGDTDALATALWHRRYMGQDDPRLWDLAAARRPHLYLLTGDELPFVQDGLRDGEHVRHDMHRWFLDTLRAQPVPWRLLTGPPARRLAEARAAVATLLPGGRP